jgi:hypothetical protein
MEENFIYCEIAESEFGKTNKAESHNGDVSVDYLTNARSPQIETGAREYQREKVASLSWKQKVMLTVITNGYRKIPQIHIRVIKTHNGFRFELVDGQQRITSIIDFVKGKYSLPNTDEFNLGNGIDVRGKKFEDLPSNIKTQILEYRISCLWYENLSDEQTADLFINVLNNTNAMKPQEIRNAVRGFISTLIRNTARFDERHDLFERSISDGKNKKQTLKYFSNGFTLGGRMEVDEWLSELIYMQDNGYRNGVSQNKHTQWITDVQATGGKYSTEAQFNEFNETMIQPLISFSYDVITNVPSELKYKLSPMLSQMLILYGLELKNKYGKIDIPTYNKKFFEVYDKWSNTKDKLYANEIMWGTDKNGTQPGEQMEPFYKLFGGRNFKAIGTITYILDKELALDEDSFGVVEIDVRNFSKAQIIQKWEEQGRKCFFTGQSLELKDIAGDHYIPRSWGIKKGGVTEIDNLAVTSKKLNLKKLNMHGDDFIKMLNDEMVVA